MSSELSTAEALLERPQRRESGTVESGLRVLRASNMMLITKEALCRRPASAGTVTVEHKTTRENRKIRSDTVIITCSHHNYKGGVWTCDDYLQYS
jgi:hypothetical protein